MATYEHNALQQYKDQNGNMHLIYPITKAENVDGFSEAVQMEISDLKKSVSDGKTAVANAITAKGVTTATDATFAVMASNISQIKSGVDTSDTTATASMIVNGKTAYVNGEKITGTLGTLITANKLSKTVAPDMTTYRQHLASASVGEYALFAGGENGNGRISSVDAYNASLVRTTAPAMSCGRCFLASASVDEYALFAGGIGANWNDTSLVEAYNASLVRTTAPPLSYLGRQQTGARNNNYALFAGGWNYSSSSYNNLNTVNAYNASLVRSIPTTLCKSRYEMSGGSNGYYALFAGGATMSSNGNYTYVNNYVDAYDNALVRYNPTNLEASVSEPASASVGDYALFAGGWGYPGSYYQVNAYNTNLVYTQIDRLYDNANNFAGGNFGNYALFAGGDQGVIGKYPTVATMYDISLVRSSYDKLSVDRANVKSAKAGTHLLFAGGGTSPVVDVYKCDNVPAIHIPETTIYL